MLLQLLLNILSTKCAIQLVEAPHRVRTCLENPWILGVWFQGLGSTWNWFLVLESPCFFFTEQGDKISTLLNALRFRVVNAVHANGMQTSCDAYEMCKHSFFFLHQSHLVTLACMYIVPRWATAHVCALYMFSCSHFEKSLNFQKGVLGSPWKVLEFLASKRVQIGSLRGVRVRHLYLKAIYLLITVILRGRAGYELIYITNEAVGRVGYHQLISGKSEKNNCFSKFSSSPITGNCLSTHLFPLHKTYSDGFSLFGQT